MPEVNSQNNFFLGEEVEFLLLTVILQKSIELWSEQNIQHIKNCHPSKKVNYQIILHAQSWAVCKLSRIQPLIMTQFLPEWSVFRIDLKQKGLLDVPKFLMDVTLYHHRYCWFSFGDLLCFLRKDLKKMIFKISCSKMKASASVIWVKQRSKQLQIKAFLQHHDAGIFRELWKYNLKLEVITWKAHIK